MRSRLLVAGVLLGACSFEPRGSAAGEPGSDGSAADASGPGDDDASALADAVPADGPTPALLETLIIPATGEVVTSTVVLETGVVYRLIAAGVVSVRDDGWDADSDYLWHEDLPDLVSEGAGGIDYGLAVDDPEVDGERSPDWGAHSDGHSYETPYTGLGATITGQFHDVNWENNSGSLTLEIHGPP